MYVTVRHIPIIPYTPTLYPTTLPPDYPETTDEL